MPISETGGPRQYFLPFENSRPKYAPFCDFSVFVHFYVLFRNPVLAVPIMHGNLSLLGLIRFCTIICMFSDYVPVCRASRFSLYIGTGAGAVFVPILSLFCSF